MAELRAIEFVDRLIEQGRLPHGTGPKQYRHIRVHRIVLEGFGERLSSVEPSCATISNRSSFCASSASARRGASSTAHYDDIGVRGSIDLRAELAAG